MNVIKIGPESAIKFMAYEQVGSVVCIVSNGATRGVTVSMSAFLACHQCYCAGSSLAWGLFWGRRFKPQPRLKPAL